jgi:hypothetical protein
MIFSTPSCGCGRNINFSPSKISSTDCRTTTAQTQFRRLGGRVP